MYMSCSLILSCMHFRIINVKFAVLNSHPIHVLLHLISWLNSFCLGPGEAGVGGGGECGISNGLRFLGLKNLGFEIFVSLIFLDRRIWQVFFGWLDLRGVFWGYSKESEYWW